MKVPSKIMFWISINMNSIEMHVSNTFIFYILLNDLHMVFPGNSSNQIYPDSLLCRFCHSIVNQIIYLQIVKQHMSHSLV